MVINGSVAPRPMVNSNDDASNAEVERFTEDFIILPDVCPTIAYLILLCLITIIMPSGGLYRSQFISKCLDPLPKIMICSSA
jgi:hypothetical protein